MECMSCIYICEYAYLYMLYLYILADPVSEVPRESPIAGRLGLDLV